MQAECFGPLGLCLLPYLTHSLYDYLVTHTHGRHDTHMTDMIHTHDGHDTHTHDRWPSHSKSSPCHSSVSPHVLLTWPCTMRYPLTQAYVATESTVELMLVTRVLFSCGGGLQLLTKQTKYGQSTIVIQSKQSIKQEKWVGVAFWGYFSESHL